MKEKVGKEKKYNESTRKVLHSLNEVNEKARLVVWKKDGEKVGRTM